jgi:hypothetical protein
MRRILRVALTAIPVLAVGCVGWRGSTAIPLRESVLRVNCGSAEVYTDAAGNTWLADDGGSGNLSWESPGAKTIRRDSREIPGTICPGVYLTEAYGMTSYVLNLPEEVYAVRLHFAETYEGITAPGQRVFSVAVNGVPMLTDFDILSEAAGPYRPLVKTLYDVEPTDGVVTIGFTPGVQNPAINGIEVFRK